MKKSCYMLLFAVICLAGCKDTDNSNLRADIEELKMRISALEIKTGELNNNIKAIRELTKEGMTITEAIAQNGIYTLTLSDGSTVRLVEKTAIDGSVPFIGINSEGNWQVSYDAGATYVLLKGSDGRPVQARGKDGITPVFRINGEGYWQVSDDGGTSYRSVTDEKGNPVKAVVIAATDNTFFTRVTPTEKSLDIVLKDGTELSIPIIKNFFCYFDTQYQGIQTIRAGSSTTFNVYIKGVENTIVTAPDGWKAMLGAPNADTNIAILTVVALVATRAVADNTKDVSILAVAGTFAQLAKLQVQLK